MVQQAQGQLASKGLKATHQRLVILAALLERHDHPTADRLYAMLHPAHPSLGLATVYKTLEALAAAGLIHRVESADGLMRYDARQENHHHIYCENTHEIIDFHDPELEELITAFFKKGNQ
ncbi:MAG: transcriptional repressor [Cytophagales bacterium]|nr:transcriptional repressor [Cytophagales bacterium]